MKDGLIERACESFEPRSFPSNGVFGMTIVVSLGRVLPHSLHGSATAPSPGAPRVPPRAPLPGRGGAELGVAARAPRGRSVSRRSYTQTPRESRGVTSARGRRAPCTRVLISLHPGLARTPPPRHVGAARREPTPTTTPTSARRSKAHGGGTLLVSMSLQLGGRQSQLGVHNWGFHFLAANG